MRLGQTLFPHCKSIAKPAKIRIENKGKMLFYTSLLKSFPGGKGKVWKELIEEGFGEPYIRREFSAFPSIGSFVSQQSVKLGERKNISYTILPSYGARKGPHIANVKTMLDTWYKSDPPSVEMVDKWLCSESESIILKWKPILL